MPVKPGRPRLVFATPKQRLEYVKSTSRSTFENELGIKINHACIRDVTVGQTAYAICVLCVYKQKHTKFSLSKSDGTFTGAAIAKIQSHMVSRHLAQSKHNKIVKLYIDRIPERISGGRSRTDLFKIMEHVTDLRTRRIIIKRYVRFCVTIF